MNQKSYLRAANSRNALSKGSALEDVPEGKDDRKMPVSQGSFSDMVQDSFI